jgi:ABC-type amino acid transport substrate-binding protein
VRRLTSALGITLITTLAVAGCSVRVPTDPDGTLDRVRSAGILRAGASPAGDALTVTDATPSGPLVELVDRFAASEGAEVEWTVGGEEELVGRLEAGALDLVAGDFSEQTPWVDQVSVTRGIRGVDGLGDRPVVMLLPLGENAMQAALEVFIDSEVEP